MEKSLKDLLSRLPIPGLKESNDRHIIADVVTKLLTIPIKPNQINVKEGTITFSVPPIVKSALHVRETELLELLSKKGIQARGIR